MPDVLEAPPVAPPVDPPAPIVPDPDAPPDLPFPEGSSVTEALAHIRGEEPPAPEAPVGEKPPASPTSKADEKPNDWLTPELMEWAKEAELSDEEAREFQSPELLTKHLRHYDRQVRILGRDRLREARNGVPQKQASDGPPAPPPTKPAPTGTAKPGPLQNDDFSFKKPEITASEKFDDAAAIESINPALHMIHGQMETLRAEIVNIARFVQQQLNQPQQAAFNPHELFDEFVAGLGDDWKDDFGAGKASETLLKGKDTVEGKRLARIAEAYDELVTGLASRKGSLQAVTRDEALKLMRRAHGSEFINEIREKEKTRAKRELEGSLRARANGTVGKPSARVDPGVRGDPDSMTPILGADGKPIETEAQFRARVGARINAKHGIRAPVLTLN